MKKILTYLISIIMLGGLAGCDSVLDLDPHNNVTFDHFFRDENDLEALFRQMNADLRNRFISVSYQEHMGMKADRLYNASDIEKIRSLDANYLTALIHQQQWKGFYNVLALVDLFFDNYTKVQGLSEDRLNFYKGESYFIRAVCYFQLTKTWGDAVITKGSTFVAPYSKSPAREVLDTAIYAAEQAYRCLPKHENLRNVYKKKLVSKQYGSKGNAAALLAHMYAWKGALYNDPEATRAAVEWADRLIEPKYKDEVGNYELAQSAEEVCTEVMGRNSSEAIFEIEINYADISYYGHFFPGSLFVSYPIMRNVTAEDIVTKSQYGLKRSTVNSMYENSDERRTHFFYEQDIEGQNAADLAYLYKWRKAIFEASGETIYFDGMDCNRTMIRLAGIYLLRAECEARLSQNSKAIADLNTIRGLRSATAWPNSPLDSHGDLAWAIFLERERELLYEGHRYYDAVRNGYYGKNNKHKGVLSTTFDNLTESDIKNGALYLPIPETAFRDNDLMIQNTYWMSKMK